MARRKLNELSRLVERVAKTERMVALSERYVSDLLLWVVHPGHRMVEYDEQDLLPLLKELGIWIYKHYYTKSEEELKVKLDEAREEIGRLRERVSELEAGHDMYQGVVHFYPLDKEKTENNSK